MSKPALAKGTRDFGPLQMARRKYIFSSIEKVFQLYGFMPLETPAMEQLSTLMGKYGDEGDQLLFKILNSGDFLDKSNTTALQEKNSKKLTLSISEKGLRYDLTVPFARYVVMNQHEVTYPFKRYQMQPVWRADRPQKGRYREFWQCDADVVGSNSLLHEADLLAIYDTVFRQLQIPVVILINNRKLLEGIAEAIGAKDKFMDFTVALDKLDKIGWDGVEKEMTARGIDSSRLDTIKPLLEPKLFNHASIAEFAKLLSASEIGMKGVEELQQVCAYLEGNPAIHTIRLDGTLARGLSYYTGCIMEVKPLNVSMGSLGGGGRYDDLTGNFGLKGVSGVGISFGADRIYDVLEELKLFPEEGTNFTDILFCPMDDKALLYCLPAAARLRSQGIKTEVYPQAAKLKKQLDYANAKNIRYAAIVGDTEMHAHRFMLKDLQSGEQSLQSADELIGILKP